MSMVNIPSTNTDPSYRYKMPRLAAKVEGRGNGIKTAVMNCKEVAAAIHRPPDYVMKWFGYELCAKSSYEDKAGEGERALVTGAHLVSTLQESLDKFLGVYVLCPTCGLPEMNLKMKKDNIHGACNACGFAGYLKEATCHKMATYVLKNPPTGENLTDKKKEKKEKKNKDADDADGGGKSKKKKKDKKNQKDAGGGDGGSSDEDAPAPEDGSDDEKKKKKKKEKKSKKSKSEGSDPGGMDDSGSQPNSASKSKGGDTKATSSDEEQTEQTILTAHRDEEVLGLIAQLRQLQQTEGSAEFVEEARLLILSAQLEKKMLVYMVLEAFFPQCRRDDVPSDDLPPPHPLNKDNIVEEGVAAKFVGMVKEHGISVRDMMWGFELYVHEHRETTLKGFPLVCKALYDLDLIDEQNFLPYCEDPRANAENPGHEMVRKVIAPFAKWLKANSDNDSDSD